MSLSVAQMGEVVTQAEFKCIAGVTQGNPPVFLWPVFSLCWQWMSLKHFADKPILEEQPLHFCGKWAKACYGPN